MVKAGLMRPRRLIDDRKPIAEANTSHKDAEWRSVAACNLHMPPIGGEVDFGVSTRTESRELKLLLRVGHIGSYRPVNRGAVYKQ